MATPTKADIEKARKHFWDSAPSRTPEEAIEKLAQFRADAVADEREAAYRAGQENFTAMKTEIQSVYDQVCLIPERPKTTQAFINGLARAMVTLGMKEPIPHGGDYCDEPPPSEGKA